MNFQASMFSLSCQCFISREVKEWEESNFFDLKQKKFPTSALLLHPHFLTFVIMPRFHSMIHLFQHLVRNFHCLSNF